MVLFAGGALSAVLLYLTLRKVALDDVWREVVRVSWPILGFAVLIRATNLLIASIRSRILLAPLHRFGLGRLFKSVLLAFAVNNVLPLRAGELARVGYLARYGGVPASSCLAVVAFERLLDSLALLLLLTASLPAIAGNVKLGGSTYVLAGAAVGAVGVALFVSSRPGLFVSACRALASLLGRRFARFIESKAQTFSAGLAVLKSPVVIITVMLLSLATWLLTTVSIRVWIWAFDLDLPWFAPVVVLAFLSVGMAVPSTPGHIGTFHFFTMTAMTTLGVAAATATSFAVVAHFVAVVPLTLVAVPLLLGDALRRAPIGEPADAPGG